MLWSKANHLQEIASCRVSGIRNCWAGSKIYCSACDHCLATVWRGHGSNQMLLGYRAAQLPMWQNCYPCDVTMTSKCLSSLRTRLASGVAGKHQNYYSGTPNAQILLGPKMSVWLERCLSLISIALGQNKVSWINKMSWFLTTLWCDW